MKLNKSFSFSMAHRLPLHKGGCSNFHGHNYDVIVELSTKESDEYIGGVGYVIDFGEIKKIVNDMFDHKMILHKEDKYAKDLENLNLPGLVLVDYSPTAENMALHIAQTIKVATERILNSQVEVSISLWETASSFVVKTLR